MAYNLKNRPDLNRLLKQNSGLSFHYCKITAEWFEGFEKRQRFLISKNEHGISRIAVLLDKHNKLGLDPVQAIEWFIKNEIFGGVIVLKGTSRLGFK